MPPRLSIPDTGQGLTGSLMPVLIFGGLTYAGYEIGKRVFDLGDTEALLLGAGITGVWTLWAMRQVSGEFSFNPMAGALRTALPGIAVELNR